RPADRITVVIEVGPGVRLVPDLPPGDGAGEVAGEGAGRAAGERADVGVVAIAAADLGTVGEPLVLAAGPGLVREQPEHLEVLAPGPPDDVVVDLEGGAAIAAGRGPILITAAEAEVDSDPAGPGLLHQR